MSAKVAAKGHTVKHTKTSKATAKKTAKHAPVHHKKAVTHKATGHKVTTKGTHAHHAKAVGFAVGDLLPVCAFEAVAMSARLAGARVHDDDVCELWHLLGEPEDGVPVGEALAAAALLGLAGFRPAEVHELDVPHAVVVQHHPELGAFHVGQFQGLDDRAVALLDGDQPAGAVLLKGHGGDVGRRDAESILVHGLILRIDVPGPHAVLATADGWWSWGELHSPWPCRISEAWAVSWS